ncbi:MAG: flagellar basal body-associated protein FliL [Bradymonadia bacterium]
MAADETVENEEEGGGKGGGSKLLMIMLLVNTLGLGGLAAYVVLGGGGDASAAAETGDVAEEALEPPEEMEDMPAAAPGATGFEYTDMKELVINLNEPSGDRYLKTKINLQLDSEETKAEIDLRKSQIRYQLNVLLSGQRVVDVQGPENMESLRKAMVRRINASLSKGRVTGVWMVDWIVQ